MYNGEPKIVKEAGIFHYRILYVNIDALNFRVIFMCDLDSLRYKLNTHNLLRTISFSGKDGWECKFKSWEFECPVIYFLILPSEFHSNFIPLIIWIWDFRY